MLFKQLRTAAKYWVEDQAGQMGAALAYYALFSLAPLLIIAITIAGQIYGPQATRAQILEWIQQANGKEVADAVRTLLENQKPLADSFWPWLLGLSAIVFGAVSLFTQLRASLDRIWRFPPPPTHGIIVRVVRDYLLALLMVLSTCAFVVLLLASSTLVALLHRVEFLPPGEHWAWRLGDFVASALLLLLLFAFTYRFMSDGAIQYRHVWTGALVSAVLFTLGKMAIGFYLAHSQVMSAFGAAGSLVALLVWVYYSAQIFFFGAEIIRVRLGR